MVLSALMNERALSLGISQFRLLILNGGSDTADISFIPDNRAVKLKYGLPPDLLTFGFIGMNEGELLDITSFIIAINDLKTIYG